MVKYEIEYIKTYLSVWEMQMENTSLCLSNLNLFQTVMQD